MRHEVLRLWMILAGAFMVVIGLAGNLYAQTHPDWTEPFPPFRIARNLYYLGNKDLASYLIATSQGQIAINASIKSRRTLSNEGSTIQSL